MVYIYILQLKYGKYYVGKTNNPNIRIDDHFNSNGSTWTSKYKPIKVEKVIPNCDDFDEDKYTLQYMEKFGINNVRGGSFTTLYLSDADRQTINRMIKGSSDKCFNCGQSGHFANNCQQNNNTANDYKISIIKPNCRVIIYGLQNQQHYNCKEGVTINFNNNMKKWLVKIGDTSIYVGEKKLILNEPGLTGMYIKPSNTNLIGDVYDLINGVSQVLNNPTTNKLWDIGKSVYNYVNDNDNGKNKCYRCGREGHYASECYATYHNRGHRL